MPTLMVMAGGTGGHIYPGLAVADALRERGWKVVWMGNPDGMEARIVPASGYEVAWVRFTALRGKGCCASCCCPSTCCGLCPGAGADPPRRPDVVLGMGGYVTFPGGMMAALLGRPVVVHEQNSVAGLANRVLAGVADKVVTGFPGVLKKGEWLGNPVRADITAVAPPAARFAGRSGPLKVLVVGGSLGAAALNEAMPKALALLAPEDRPQVTHQAGTKQIEALRAGYQAAGVRASCCPSSTTWPRATPAPIW
jgi:UDP-N-acetylglucosamine--N-acetylmuramyl-(pentapeptide) pyrophosphoryl-undecaprenol N-acetylglucosamine transferase